MKKNNEKLDSKTVTASNFDQILDNASLLKFCQDKNKNKEALDFNDYENLTAKIKKDILTKEKSYRSKLFLSLGFCMNLISMAICQIFLNMWLTLMEINLII